MPSSHTSFLVAVMCNLVGHIKIRFLKGEDVTKHMLVLILAFY